MADTGTPSNSIDTATWTADTEITAGPHSTAHADIKAKFAAHTHDLAANSVADAELDALRWRSVHASQQWAMVSGTVTGTSSAAGAINDTITFATDAQQGDPSFLTGATGSASIQVMVNVYVGPTTWFVGTTLTSGTTACSVIGQLVKASGSDIVKDAQALAYSIDWVVVGRNT